MAAWEDIPDRPYAFEDWAGIKQHWGRDDIGLWEKLRGMFTNERGRARRDWERMAPAREQAARAPQMPLGSEFGTSVGVMEAAAAANAAQQDAMRERGRALEAEALTGGGVEPLRPPAPAFTPSAEVVGTREEPNPEALGSFGRAYGPFTQRGMQNISRLAAPRQIPIERSRLYQHPSRPAPVAPGPLEAPRPGAPRPGISGGPPAGASTFQSIRSGLTAEEVAALQEENMNRLRNYWNMLSNIKDWGAFPESLRAFPREQWRRLPWERQ